MAKTRRTYPPRTIEPWRAAQDVLDAEAHLATAREIGRDVANWEALLRANREALVIATGSEAAAEAELASRRAFLAGPVEG